MVLHRAINAFCRLGLALFLAATLFCSPRGLAQDHEVLHKAFADAMTGWKQSAKDAIAASEQFRLGDADQAEENRQAWIQAIENGRNSFHKLVETGTKLIETDSHIDPDVMTFLALALESRYDVGDYEGAYKVGNTLLTAAPNAAGLLLRHIFNAFATNRFDDCRARIEQLVQVAGGVPSELTSIASSVDTQIASWQRESELREAEGKADDLPRVELVIRQYDSTERIVLELFENEAPNTVANFISLVESGFYSDRAFFRVATHFDAAAGCPADDGTGNPGYFIASEATKPDARHHFRGSLATVSMDPTDKAGSQFCLLFAPNPGLNGRSTVFGRMLEGFDVLDRLTRTHFLDDSTQKLQQYPNIPAARIESARVLRKRDHAYVPEKLTQ